METFLENFSFKSALALFPRGEPLDLPYLKEVRMSANRAAHLAKSGWLIHLGRGVYMLPGDTLTRDGCLAYLMRRNPDLHVGSRTALEWRGIKHNVSFREVISLWGTAPMRLPEWLQSRFPCAYQTTSLFSADLPAEFGIQKLPAGHDDVRVSVPERALLELLSDVGKKESLQDARLIVEGARNLRSAVLEMLLQHTTRIKVLRLARALAEELDLPWVTLAKKYSEAKGGGSRWIAVSKDGERLDLKQ